MGSHNDSFRWVVTGFLRCYGSCIRGGGVPGLASKDAWESPGA